METSTELRFRDRKLTHASLETSLRGARAYIKDQGWSHGTRESGLLVNLYKVEWCDLSAAVRLVLFIEAALRDGIRVQVAMPVPHARGSERALLEEWEEKRWHGRLQGLRKRIERRDRARNFLSFIRFEAALSCPHLSLQDGQLTFVEDYAPPKSASSEAGEDEDDGHLRAVTADDPGQATEDFPTHETTYKNIFPLHWFESPDLATVKLELERLKGFLVGVVSEGQRGILRFDAEALANVIFHELIRNTKDHADVAAPHSLVAAWCRKPGQDLYSDQYHAQEAPFFNEWVKPNRFPLVDIAIGDSGVGIVRSLGSTFAKERRPFEGVPREIDNAAEQTLFWSLGRWSTRTSGEKLRRGTRGLYRVHRLVKGYHGLLTVRSYTSLIGWNHGGHDVHNWFQASGLACAPGTSLSIRLPSVLKAEEPTKSPPVNDRTVEYTFAVPLELSTAGLTEEARTDLAARLSTGDPDKHRCVIAILGSLPDEPEDRKQSLGNAFEQLGELVSPGALALLVPGISTDDLDIHLDSFTQETDEAAKKKRREEQRSDRKYRIGAGPEHYHISSLFVVFDIHMRPRWTGGTVDEVALLDLLQKSRESRLGDSGIRAALPDGDDRHETLTSLKQQVDSFVFQGDGSVSLRFNGNDVFGFASRSVCRRLEDALDDPLRLGIQPGPFLAPSLVYVKEWLSKDCGLTTFGWFWVTDELLGALAEVKATKKELTAVEQYRGLPIESFEALLDLLKLKLSSVHFTALDHLVIAKAAHVPFGPHFVQWAMAATIAQEHGSSSSRLLCDSATHDGGSQRLAALLGIPGMYTKLLGLSALGQPRAFWEDIAGDRVMVYCDWMLSGNSARDMVEQGIRSGAKPAAVACIYDFRASSARGLEYPGGEVPVVSLVQTPGRLGLTSAPRKYRYIDSGSGQPETVLDRLANDLTYPIGREEMDRYIERTSALYFNHIVHAATHGTYRGFFDHFTFYLDADRLLSDPECLQATRRALRNQIDAATDELQWPNGSPLIFYASNDQVREDRARDLLSGLNSAPGSNAIPLDMTALDFPRDVSDKAVVIIDWYARTGKTISSLAYAAAANGAQSVLAIIWLSRMPEEEERILRALGSLLVPLGASPNYLEDGLFAPLIAEEKGRQKPSSQGPRPVPVRIAFISQAKIVGYAEGDCPVCSHRERVMGQSRSQADRSPDQYLREFISNHMSRFRPKELREMRDVSDMRDRDCFGAAISPLRASAMFRLRDNLDVAIRSTRKRLEVSDHLHLVCRELEESSSKLTIEAEAIVSLLAMELQWVKLPPLNFLDMRREVGKLSTLVLDRSQDQATLQQAIIVLRAADKLRFATSLPDLARRFVDRPRLLTQLLYDAFTIIDAPYQVGSVLRMLVDSLGELAEVIEDQRRKNPNGKYLSIHASAQAIHAQGIRRLRHAADDSETLPQAWLRLKDFLLPQLKNAHDTLPKGNYALFFQAPDIEARLEKVGHPIASPGFWDESRRKWAASQVLLEEQVFEPLRRCWDVLRGTYGANFFSPPDLSFLEEVTWEKTSANLRLLNDLLTQFSKGAPLAGGDDWREFKRLRGYINRILLEVHVKREDKRDDKREERKGSMLYQFLHECPTNLMKALRRDLDSEKWKRNFDIHLDAPSVERLSVFCHRELLGELLDELYTNAISHKVKVSKKRKSSEDPYQHVSVGIGVTFDEGKDRVTLSFSCSGTDPSLRDASQPGEGGQGLLRLKKALEPYGAVLAHGPGPKPVWDYTTTIEFLYGGQ